MPIDRGEIDAQLKEIGEGERWWEYREFRELPHVLHAGERLRGITSGVLLDTRRPRIRMANRWVIVATTQRLLLLKQERFARKQVDIPAGQIIRIHQSSRLRSFQIEIDTPLRRYRIRIPKDDAFRFAGTLGPLMANPQAQQLTAYAPPAPQAVGPGMAMVPVATPVRTGVLSRLFGRTPRDYTSRAYVEQLEATVDRLEQDVERLQQQVAFLEALLQKRSDEAFLPRSPVDS